MLKFQPIINRAADGANGASDGATDDDAAILNNLRTMYREKTGKDCGLTDAALTMVADELTDDADIDDIVLAVQDAEAEAENTEAEPDTPVSEVSDVSVNKSKAGPYVARFNDSASLQRDVGDYVEIRERAKTYACQIMDDLVGVYGKELDNWPIPDTVSTGMKGTISNNPDKYKAAGKDGKKGAIRSFYGDLYDYSTKGQELNREIAAITKKINDKVGKKTDLLADKDTLSQRRVAAISVIKTAVKLYYQIQRLNTYKGILFQQRKSAGKDGVVRWHKVVDPFVIADMTDLGTAVTLSVGSLLRLDVDKADRSSKPNRYEALLETLGRNTPEQPDQFPVTRENWVAVAERMVTFLDNKATQTAIWKAVNAKEAPDDMVLVVGKLMEHLFPLSTATKNRFAELEQAEIDAEKPKTKAA
jgi:hypothetical protein